MPYVCSICDRPIVDEDPHTDPATGEDVHVDCCPVCLDAHGAREAACS